MESFKGEVRRLVKHAILAVAAAVTGQPDVYAPTVRAEPVQRTCALTPNPDNGADPDFQRDRQQWGTRLRQLGPAPDLYRDPIVREGVRLTRYVSEAGELKIWHVAPAHTRLWSASGYPAVIYVHDGTSLSEDELHRARAFSEAGLAVFLPTFRGENGNPGFHELLFGELDDLVAATAYAAGFPDIDGDRLAIWGHGLGGMLTALSSLVSDLGVRYTGSSAGVRTASAFDVLQRPFEDTEGERRSRLFGPNLRHMHSPHWACVAEQDPATLDEAVRLEGLALRDQLPLRVERVGGDRSVGRDVCTAHSAGFLSEILAPTPAARAMP